MNALSFVLNMTHNIIVYARLYFHTHTHALLCCGRCRQGAASPHVWDPKQAVCWYDFSLVLKYDANIWYEQLMKISTQLYINAIIHTRTRARAASPHAWDTSRQCGGMLNQTNYDKLYTKYMILFSTTKTCVIGYYKHGMSRSSCDHYRQPATSNCHLSDSYIYKLMTHVYSILRYQAWTRFCIV